MHPIRENLVNNRELSESLTPAISEPELGALIRPGQRDLTLDQLLENEAGGLTSFDDCTLNIGREEGDVAKRAFVGAGGRATLP